MSMKKDSGITLVTLIITIIVLIILSVTVIFIGDSSIDNTLNARITNEMIEIETAIIKRFSNHMVNEDAYPLIGEKIDATDAINEIQNSVGAEEEALEHINTNIDYVRKINASAIGALGVKQATGSTYIVDYLNGKVYGPEKGKSKKEAEQSVAKKVIEELEIANNF